jgi:PadR family transcriptional regulator, regulatory protein PadR
MAKQKEYLGQFEEIVMLAILHLGSNSYGTKIRQTVEEALEKTISIGAIYTTLERLEQKGYLTSWQGEATQERGGRAKRYFEVTGAGQRTLKNNDVARHKLSELVLAQ